MRALSLCTCCRHYPGTATGGTALLIRSVMSAFPERVVGSACASSFSRLTQRSLALRPAHSRCHQCVARLPEGFRHFVTSMPAPVASGWSGCRVGLAPTEKRRLFTAHTHQRRSEGVVAHRQADARPAGTGRDFISGVGTQRTRFMFSLLVQTTDAALCDMNRSYIAERVAVRLDNFEVRQRLAAILGADVARYSRLLAGMNKPHSRHCMTPATPASRSERRRHTVSLRRESSNSVA